MGVFVGVVSVIGIFVIVVNVNLLLWRRNVVFEIYVNVIWNKEVVVREVMFNISEWCWFIIVDLNFIVV